MKHDSIVNDALLTEDEHRILSWSNDNSVRLWNADTGEQIGPAMKHDSRVYGARLTKDEHRILSWSSDKTLRLWDVATSQQIGPAMKHAGSVYGARLTKDDQRILSWSNDKTVRLWDVSWRGSNLFEIACNYWPDRELESVGKQYGMTIDKLICSPAQAIPLPNWASIKPTPDWNLPGRNITTVPADPSGPH